MDRIFRHLGPVLAQVNKTLYTVLPILARAAREFGAPLHQLEKIFGAQNVKNSPWGFFNMIAFMIYTVILIRNRFSLFTKRYVVLYLC